MNLREQGRTQAYTPALPSITPNTYRTYSAHGSLAQRFRKQRGPEEDAYKTQKEGDDLSLNLRERGYGQVAKVPVMDTINPARAYSADEPSNAPASKAMSLSQIFDAADEAYESQEAFDNLPLTLTERGYLHTRSIPIPDTRNPRATYSADEPITASYIDIQESP